MPSETRAWPIAVYGDSIASNFAMVLRLAGRSPMQMTGHGCSVVPSAMRPECRVMADKLGRAAQSAGSELLIIDAAAHFCGDRPGCSAMGPTPLMCDLGGHLAVEGARRYAKRLLDSRILDETYP